MKVNEEYRKLFWNYLIPQLQNEGIELSVPEKSKGMKYLYGTLNKENINKDNVDILIDLNSVDDYYKDSFNDGIPVIWVEFKGNNKVQNRDQYYSLLNQNYKISIKKDDEADDYSKVMIRRSNKNYKLELGEEVTMVKEILQKVLRTLNEDNN